MANVRFVKGTAAQFEALGAKDANTFYYIDETDLYLGATKISNKADLDAAIVRIGKNETNIGDVTTLTTAQKGNLVAAINSLKSSLEELTGNGSTGGTVSEMIEQVTGDVADLNTTANTLVGAVNELKDSIDTEKTAAKVTIESTTASAGAAKTYSVKQGDTVVGTIDIPKDMVVSSGKVVVDPAGQTPGTYVELTLANNDGTKLYINVSDLIDVYTAAQNAAQVQLAVNGTEISASIVAESISATELAANAVETAKIKDKNVTKAKLADDVQTSLGKADSAVQSVEASTANGYISVDGTDVAIKGLKSAAYTEASEYEKAGAAATALNDAKSYADGLASNYDAAGSASAVVGNSSDASTANTVYGAKKYADEAVANATLSWETIA